jgi:cell division protein FtsB
MILFILFLCFVSKNVNGEDLKEMKNLQSILKELETMKTMHKEIDYLKERTLALEKQNKQLNQKIEKLEIWCAAKTEKVII